ncbi:MAG TPA: cyclic nucleotide-binding domain-containing protein, partial [Thermoanaerobaculia bacterium]|nr:cyclic nucleotide-binding domain-containing protein [Thermoanaerobaculia bacterium]
MSAQIATDALQTARPLVADLLAPFERPESVRPGSVLFREGEEPRGVYLVRDGQFDLIFASRLGDSKPLRTATSGQILGLSCVVSNRPHDCSATARS